jgi:hypothetical protein
VFLDVAHRDVRGTDIRQKLDESQLADLFIWLSDAFPRSTDPQESNGFVTPRQDLTRYRDYILNIVSGRGTASSVAALDRMATATGQTFPYARIAAEDNRRSLAWRPPSPEEIIRLASDPTLRLVRSDEDLHELLVREALPRVQQKLSDEGRAHQIWDTYSGRPKQETEISAWIADELRDDLQARGVIINREVEIRVAPRGIGERTDIHVDATAINAAGTSDRLTVVIEVKGCWHRDLLTAMSSQLADQYLSDAHPFGVYLVAWFGGDRWTTGDGRRADCERRDLDNIRAELAQQAADLQSSGYRIAPVIINCTW